MLQEVIRRYAGDLSDATAQEARRVGLIAWDIETSGLDWKKDKIATCQIFVPDCDVFVIQLNGHPHAPMNLRSLLSDSEVLKIFHHAMFDLRFMAFNWRVEVRNVACTKIASRLLDPLEDDHSLKHILQKYLNVQIDKEPRVSNWLINTLTPEQLDYAARDVLHLPRLFADLRAKLRRSQRWPLAEKSFEFLPTRVQLDLLGAGDVFRY